MFFPSMPHLWRWRENVDRADLTEIEELSF